MPTETIQLKSGERVRVTASADVIERLQKAAFRRKDDLPTFGLPADQQRDRENRALAIENLRDNLADVRRQARRDEHLERLEWISGEIDALEDSVVSQDAFHEEVTRFQGYVNEVGAAIRETQADDDEKEFDQTRRRFYHSNGEAKVGCERDNSCLDEKCLCDHCVDAFCDVQPDESAKVDQDELEKIAVVIEARGAIMRVKELLARHYIEVFPESWLFDTAASIAIKAARELGIKAPLPRFFREAEEGEEGRELLTDQFDSYLRGWAERDTGEIFIRADLRGLDLIEVTAHETFHHYHPKDTKLREHYEAQSKQFGKAFAAKFARGISAASDVYTWPGSNIEDIGSLMDSKISNRCYFEAPRGSALIDWHTGWVWRKTTWNWERSARFE